MWEVDECLEEVEVLAFAFGGLGTRGYKHCECGIPIGVWNGLMDGLWLLLGCDSYVRRVYSQRGGGRSCWYDGGGGLWSPDLCGRLWSRYHSAGIGWRRELHLVFGKWIESTGELRRRDLRHCNACVGDLYHGRCLLPRVIVVVGLTHGYDILGLDAGNELLADQVRLECLLAI